MAHGVRSAATRFRPLGVARRGVRQAGPPPALPWRWAGRVPCPSPPPRARGEVGGGPRCPPRNRSAGHSGPVQGYPAPHRRHSRRARNDLLGLSLDTAAHEHLIFDSHEVPKCAPTLAATVEIREADSRCPLVEIRGPRGSCWPWLAGEFRPLTGHEPRTKHTQSSPTCPTPICRWPPGSFKEPSPGAHPRKSRPGQRLTRRKVLAGQIQAGSPPSTTHHPPPEGEVPQVED